MVLLATQKSRDKQNGVLFFIYYLLCWMEGKGKRRGRKEGRRKREREGEEEQTAEAER